MKWLAVLVMLLGCTEPAYLESIPQPQVYFCPRDDCEGVLLAFINSSESLSCAFYDLGLAAAIDALDSSRVIVDWRNVPENTSFRAHKGPGLMHNKFCVGGGRVLTGSMNPTENGASKNNNNIIIINSALLASNYLEEFDELWNDESRPNQVSHFVLNNKSYENYFCPEDACEDEVLAELEAARLSVYFMTYSFTSKRIANELIVGHREGKEVRGIFERRMGSSSVYGFLNYQGLDIRLDNNPNTMHHKVFIIDNETVITGSYNPTANANLRNDENLLIIHDGEVAERFLEEFRVVWGASELSKRNI
ncbi:MAG: phospholipase D-like domain-containing protein [archaeon]